MRIAAADLNLHLSRGLSPFYLVFGPEPVQHQESIEAIRAAAKLQGFAEHEVFEISANFDWSNFFATLKTPSLFSEKRLIECRLVGDKLGKSTMEALQKLVALAPSADLIFLFSGTKLDTATQNSTWFKQLDNKGCTIFARHLSGAESLRWIQKRVGEKGLELNAEMLSILTQRTEGNLLAASQAVEKLALYTSTTALTLEDLKQAIVLDTRFTVYELIDAALSGSASRTVSLISSLKNEGIEPGLLVWALSRELRLVLSIFYKTQDAPVSSHLLNRHGVWKHRETLIRNFMGRVSIQELQALLIQTKSADDIIKGRIKGSVWDLLLSVFLRLSGKTTIIQEFSC